jgi:hypothetical protein
MFPQPPAQRVVGCQAPHRLAQRGHVFHRHQQPVPAVFELLGRPVAARRDNRLVAGHRLQDDGRERVRRHLRMHQAIQRVHRPRHVPAVRCQAGLLLQPQPPDVRPQEVRHVAPPDDPEARPGRGVPDPRRRRQELALPLAPRQVVPPHHPERHVPLRQPPGTPQLPRSPRPKPGRIDPPVNHADPAGIAPQRRPRPAFLDRRLRFVDPLAQNPRHETRHRDQRVALRQQNPPAQPRTRALRQMPRQHDPRPPPRRPRRQKRRPDVPTVMRVDDVDAQFADRAGHRADEAEFEDPFPSRGHQPQSQLTGGVRHLAVSRRREPHLGTQGHQAASQLEALVVGPASGEQRVDLQNPQGSGFGFGFGFGGSDHGHPRSGWSAERPGPGAGGRGRTQAFRVRSPSPPSSACARNSSRVTNSSAET